MGSTHLKQTRLRIKLSVPQKDNSIIAFPGDKNNVLYLSEEPEAQSQTQSTQREKVDDCRMPSPQVIIGTSGGPSQADVCGKRMDFRHNSNCNTAV